MLRFRELEFSSLYAGLGIQLVDEYASVPSGLEVGAMLPVDVELDVDDGGSSWRPLEMQHVNVRRTSSGVFWFPWLEYYRDARGRLPRNYRVRVHGDAYVPRYEWDAAGIEALVHPYDDSNPPAVIPIGPIKIRLLPSQTYPFPENVPVINGVVVEAGVPVRDALVSWSDGSTTQTDTVLSDADGEFRLPLRRAPIGNAPFLVEAVTPFGGPSGFITIRIPQDLLTFQTLTIS